MEINVAVRCRTIAELKEIVSEFNKIEKESSNVKMHVEAKIG